MSSFYSDASIVLIPSGYKNQKIYSAVPTDGTGDLTFTRASSATRVQSNGLIEEVRTNVLLQSVWPNIGTGVAPTSWSSSNTDFSAGPLAGQLLCNTSASRGFISQSVSLTAGQYGLSVFVESVTVSNQINQMISIFGATDLKYYEDGIEVIPTTSIVAGKRYAVVGTVTTGSFGMRIGSGVSANATGNFVISRPQLEVSDFGATDYIPTTTAAVSVGPVSGLPRLDYLNSTCPRLLLEPQRTNLVTFSEQFNNAAWSLTFSTITPNADISPDGYTNADRIYDDAVSGQHRVSRTISVVSATTYTLSAFAKQGSLRYCFLLTTAAGTTDRYYFDLQDGVSITAGGKIEDYGNGWYRISAQVTAAATGNSLFTFNLANSSSSLTYLGTGTGYHIIYGYQVEAGAYATSYIPTLGASVTRVAELAQKTGISSLIGQTEGTIFAEINLAKLLGIQSRYILVISDNTANNRIYIAFSGSSSNILRARIFSAGVQQISIDTATISSLGKYKLALAYNNNDAVLYVNGVQIGTDTSVTIPACSQLNVCTNQAGASPFDDGINQALLFKTRLTNSELAELTAL